MIPRFFPYLPPAILVGLAVYVTVLARRRRSGPHPDGCPCDPCRAFEEAVRDACIVIGAEVVPGLRRDGKPLDSRERRVLRGIETASSRQEAQP